MSGRRRTPRYPGGPKEPSQPKGYSEDAVLSDEEVRRRVDVVGGGTPQAPPVAQRLRDRRPTPAATRPTRTMARDAILLLGLALIGLIAIIVLLPDGPLSARTSTSPATPTEGATLGAVLSTAGASTTPVGTGGLITLPPSTEGPVQTGVPGTAGQPTSPPRPTPTLGPGATPRSTPTPIPTPTPRVSAKPTASPTIPPTGSLLVQVTVLNGDGGTASAGDWLITVSSSAPASPGSFPGSAAGTSVTLKTGSTYAVTATGPSGYLKSTSADCSSAAGGKVVGGASETCTILLNDRKPTITVFTIVDNSAGGTLTPGDITVTVTGTDVTPSATFSGTSSGHAVHVRAGTSYSIDQSGPTTDYTASSVTPECAGSGLSLGDSVTCTVTFTYVAPPPSPASTAGAALLATLALLAPALRGRRWWTTSPIR
ncbi:MAG TPA: hypothetical protein VHR16_00760 [Candidatus Limnocylindrales bacterium]|nr:hypothetical protein [Candidatus Limnocylindrales bacterium]